ncbi:MAG TPA: carbon storage regulator CsrA [Ignavibacteriales bacterium]|jgi:carbon storage regulator|nr:carbon storage regulator CsrA [Ignavibacteriales bacterium]
MLVLSRKANEEIIISSDIVIKVLSISENNVKIGIVAPKDVEILRGEVYEKVKESNLQASKNAKDNINADFVNLKINKKD